MEWVETTGRSIEEAKKAALEQLGVEEADADFEVISEPKLGLFGRLREEARVRARIQPRYPRSKVDRRERRRPRSAVHADSETAAPGKPTATAEDQPASATAKERAPTTRARSATAGGTGTKAGATTGPATKDDAAGPARRRRPATSSGAAVDKTDDGAAKFGPVSTESLQAQAQAAEAFLKGLVAELGATATVSSHPVTEGIVEVDIQGDDLGTLIGPKGAALAALQELTRTVLQRQTTSEGRVIIDINGYRKQRQAALARFANQVAAEVKASGDKRALEAMSAADRKVVHDAVNDIDGVRTISEGEEPYRRVVLVPEASSGDAGSTTAAEPAAS